MDSACVTGYDFNVYMIFIHVLFFALHTLSRIIGSTQIYSIKMISSKAPRLILSALQKTQFSTPIISRFTHVQSSKGFCSSIEKKTVISEERNQASVPQHHISTLDRITLKLFGNIKGEIPNEVSYATMEEADSRRRIAVNMFLMAFCGFGSMFVVYNVKKNLQNKSQQNIYEQNSERYQQDKK